MIQKKLIIVALSQQVWILTSACQKENKSSTVSKAACEMSKQLAPITQDKENDADKDSIVKYTQTENVQTNVQTNSHSQNWQQMNY